MKKVLLTGNNSYIGSSLAKWLAQWPNDYIIDTVSVRGNAWKDVSFGHYDVVVHLAALVHSSKHSFSEFLMINRDLTYSIALKARSEGVKQFIFLSTMGVYGMETGTILNSTEVNPKTLYSLSKYEAEIMLKEIASEQFHIAIVRPPLVYGKDCRGNYERLSRFFQFVRLVPEYNNARSMLFIDNLSAFLRILIDNEAEGVFAPQNKEYVNIKELAKLIIEAHGKKPIVTRLFNPIINFCVGRINCISKVFGSLIYDCNVAIETESRFLFQGIDYETCSFKDSITKTEI